MKRSLIFLLIASLLTIITSCSVSEEKATNTENTVTEKSSGLVEDKGIYQNDSNEIIHLYVTVTEQSKMQQTNDVLSTLNHWYDFHSIEEDSPQLDVLVQEGTEKGPTTTKIGFGASQANATFEIRGASNRMASQKSYKIKLSGQSETWHGQTTINLNKHSYDFLRIRNKLSFDLMKKIPNLTSLRTQFVQLHVKDLTATSGSKTFVDYGLFTHVEQMNKDYLAAHGLNRFGQLYKAKDFEYSRYPDQLKLSTDPTYDKTAFESVLEIKGSEDHQKLLNMLDALNDSNQNINDVINQYFDRENYLSWLSTNILFGNLDTNAQNFYLYSPTNEEKFYLLPWDFDGAWDWEKQFPNGTYKPDVPPWEVGVANYWPDKLHNRFLKDPDNLEELKKKIEEISKIVSKEDIKTLLDSYYPVVHPLVSTGIDKLHLPIPLEYYDKYYWDLANVIERNKQTFYQSLENPMPIFLGEMVQADAQYFFEWEYSFDLQGDDIEYQFEIANDPAFKNIVYSKAKIKTNTIRVSKLTPGVYYWRVTIQDEKGNKQVAFDSFEDSSGQIHFGIKQIFIK